MYHVEGFVTGIIYTERIRRSNAACNRSCCSSTFIAACIVNKAHEMKTVRFLFFLNSRSCVVYQYPDFRSIPSYILWRDCGKTSVCLYTQGNRRVSSYYRGLIYSMDSANHAFSVLFWIKSTKLHSTSIMPCGPEQRHQPIAFPALICTLA